MRGQEWPEWTLPDSAWGDVECFHVLLATHTCEKKKTVSYSISETTLRRLQRRMSFCAMRQSTIATLGGHLHLVAVRKT